MANPFARAARALVRRFGFDLVRRGGVPPPPPDADPAAAATIRQVQPHTMTSPERIYALIQAVRHVCAATIPGDIVECGVWRGGSMLAAARTLLECGERERDLWLFDTFEGMSDATVQDVAIDGRSANSLLNEQDRNDARSVWCYAGLEEVQAVMSGSGYPPSRVHFVQGKVQDTLPDRAPARIALLRLDTDWYESTRHELEHLYPRLSPGGILIIDDYGHWAGCRQAVDEYFASRRPPILLQRVDYTGRMAIKPA
jgi:hypothetical protein